MPQVLQDRRIPTSLPNIDRLADGPDGVTVIYAKNIKGIVILGSRRTAKLAARPGSLTAEQIAAFRDGPARRLRAG